METLFRKVPIGEHHIGESKLCFRGNDEVYGVIYLNNSTLEWYCEDGGYKSIYGEYPTITHIVEEIQLPSDEEIEDSGKEGGLCDNELQMYWEGAVWLKRYILGFINKSSV